MGTWLKGIQQSRVDARTRRLSQKLSRFDLLTGMGLIVGDDGTIGVDDLYVLTAGDTMTGELIISVATEQLRLQYDSLNYAGFTVAADGALTITTVDAAAAAADILLMPDGKVGIGVTDPDSALEILATSTQLKLSYDASNYFIFTVQADGDLVLDSNKASYDLNFGDGNLLTTGTLGAGAITGTSLTDGSAIITGGNIQLPNGGFITTPTPGPKIEFDETNGYVEITGANVGIGTTSPQELLHIDGVTPAIRLRDSNTSGTPIARIDGSGGFLLLEADFADETASSSIRFTVDGSDKMRILADGTVGIGTINPSTTLHVSGQTFLQAVSDTADTLQVRATSTLSSPSYTGNGVDDMTAGGIFTGAAVINYRIEIDKGAIPPIDPPNSFRWSDDGGSIWNEEGVTIVAGVPYAIDNGITITFDSVQGHEVGDFWDFAATPFTGNLQEWQDVSGNNLVVIDSVGDITAAGLANFGDLIVTNQVGVGTTTVTSVKMQINELSEGTVWGAANSTLAIFGAQDETQGTRSYGQINLYDNVNSFNVLGSGAGIFFGGTYGTGFAEIGAGIKSVRESTTNLNDSWGIAFYTSFDNNSINEVARFDRNGNLIIPTGDIDLSNDFSITKDGTMQALLGIDNNGTPDQDNIYIGASDPGGGDLYYDVLNIFLYGKTIHLCDGATADGQVNVNGSLTVDNDTIINGEVEAGGSTTKIKLTSLGGYAIKLTNKTGANSVAGQLVQADTTTNDAVRLTGTDEEETMGVFLDAGIPDGSEAWIVVYGIADVAMEDDTAATRGNWVRSSVTEAGYADATNAAPPAPASFSHFNEIGNCIESVVAGGGGTHILARCVLHFN